MTREYIIFRPDIGKAYRRGDAESGSAWVPVERAKRYRYLKNLYEVVDLMEVNLGVSLVIQEAPPPAAGGVDRPARQRTSSAVEGAPTNDETPIPMRERVTGRGAAVELLPDELDVAPPLREGARYQVLVNAYERNPDARRRCIAAYGTACCICGFSVHVHDLHATLLHLMGLDRGILTYRHAGRDFRLTDVYGQVASTILAT